MKIANIGDLHGSSCWMSINPDDYDLIVFLGDYVDSFVQKDEQIVSNLIELIEFKEKYREKVILLIGNHDLQYMFSYGKYACSGFRQQLYHELHDLYNANIELFAPIYEYRTNGNCYLWTHAGISKKWYKLFCKQFKNHEVFDEFAEKITVAYNRGYDSVFQAGYMRGGGERYGGIFWADALELAWHKNLDPNRETCNDLLPKCHQIVGHNPVNDVIQYKFGDKTSITFCDTRNENNNLKLYILNI